MDIKKLLTLVRDENASDLHLIAGSVPILRINGALTPASKTPLDTKEVQELIYSMLSAEQIKRAEEEKELDLGYTVEGIGRFRVNVHFERGNPAAALRLIPAKIPALKELGLPQAVEDFTREPRGLVLVTGPTGSGKSTTQACMINIINNSQAKHIITIEDPIEYSHANQKSVIEQREVGFDTLSFSNALKHVLRQDPDVILIGEMRDLETIQTAITAAETGHLVISTLHTGDSAQSIDRIIDVFPPHQQNQIRQQLSLTLVGVISQQLLPKKDGSGRVVAAEVLKANGAIRNLIRKAQTHEIPSMIEIGKKFGMQTMDASLKELYTKKLISYEDALARAINADQLEKTLSL
ncbi:MAG: type IV pilus twitching motility protein PilT [Candidatus Margulisiibacteriota bacterium]